MSINLLKRLESSVNSFRLTLERIRKLIASTIGQLDELNQGDSFSIEWEDISRNLDADDREADMFIGGKKTRIALQDLDHITWRGYLKKDLENLDLLLLMIGSITPEHDRKLQQLIADLRGKFACPINAGNRKVIIFTAFSDTAEYLYGCLAAPILESMGCIRHSSPETWKHAVHCAFHNARSSTSIRCLRSSLQFQRRSLPFIRTSGRR